MSKGLELYESRVDRFACVDGIATIHFSHACIYNAKGLPGRDPATTWSQAAELVLEEATVTAPAPALPNGVVDGFFEADGERHEVIPLPLTEYEQGRVRLEFADGGVLEVSGKYPTLRLLGQPIRLEGL